MVSVRLTFLSFAVVLLAVAEARKLSEQHPDTAFGEEEDPADPDDDKSMNDAFAKFKKKYGKRYKNKDHEDNARSNYKESVKFVSAHNSLFAEGVEKYTMKINEFSDLSQAEFEEKLMGIKGDPDDRVVTRVAAAPRGPAREPRPHPGSMQAQRSKRQEEPPTSVDYRGYYITPIRSQAAALEGRALRYYELSDTISEQNLIDCAFESQARDPESECQPGWADLVYNCIKAAGGVDGLKTYPYTGDPGPCKYNAAAAIPNAQVSDVTILEKDELEMMREVAWNGPVAVTLFGSQRFQSYGSKGVFDDPDCADITKPRIFHAVTVVGYGTDEATGWDYWLIRNSWGTTWGDQGYMKFRRNNNNMCAIANFVVGPVIP